MFRLDNEIKLATCKTAYKTLNLNILEETSFQMHMNSYRRRKKEKKKKKIMSLRGNLLQSQLLNNNDLVGQSFRSSSQHLTSFLLKIIILQPVFGLYVGIYEKEV